MDTDPPAPRSGNRLRGCLIFGCAGLVLLSLVPPVLLWALSRAAADDAGPPREVRRRHVLPAAGPGAVPGLVELRVRMAELVVEPGPPGSPLLLEAAWDPNRFRLDEGLEQSAGGWTYHLRTHGRGLRTWLRLGGSGHVEPPKLRLLVPPGHPLALRGEVAMGTSSLELGGLALSEVDLDLGMGEHTVSFSTPLTTPLASLRIDSSMGELDVLRAGNASPRELVVAHRMGELHLDLAGAWRNDGRVDLSMGMGECRVALPDPTEAGALVEKGRVTMGSRSIEDHGPADLVPGAPTLRIRAEGAMGELEIR
jgi:hypothetical protein